MRAAKESFDLSMQSKIYEIVTDIREFTISLNLTSSHSNKHPRPGARLVLTVAPFAILGIERLSPGDYLFIRDKFGSGKPEDDHLYVTNVALRYVRSFACL